MRSTLQEISERFDKIRFATNCAGYRSYAQEMLAIPESERRGQLDDYYDTLEEIIHALYLDSCKGTLSLAEKTAIFLLIREDWSDLASDCQRASMVRILNAIQPLTGISPWLLTVADRQADPNYAAYLRGCASVDRASPAV